MAIILLLALLIAVLSLCIFTSVLVSWNELRYRKKCLPPGTMGWPIFGPTNIFKLDHNFLKNQRARHGSFFKYHTLGCPTVVSMDPELNRYILMNESKGLVPGYPQSMLDILGKCNISVVHGSTHKYMRGALLSLISPTMIREQILPKIDQFMRSHLSNWHEQVIDMQQKTKEMAFFSVLKQFAGIESTKIARELMPEFFKLVLGVFSLRIHLPGTNYHHSIKARKNIVNMLRKLIEERRASGDKEQDMLSCILKTEQNNYNLDDEEIIDLIISLLYSGNQTVSTTSMMAIKYLHDHRQALDELRKEHMGIRAKKSSVDPINWEDYRSMKFTRAVILETSRLASIATGILRMTTRDMEINGYLIPKGWRIFVYNRDVNYDPYLYPDPFAFNPWRWMDGNLETHPYFFTFGGGTRHCLGKELGIMEISTFLHYLVTRYQWEEVGGDKLVKYFPRVEATKGLHRYWVSSC
ncbi:hypothetical protein Dimus_023251 [Dionaea muscipula]